MSTKCGCKPVDKVVKTEVVPTTPQPLPVDSVGTTRNVVGTLTINRRIRPFGANNELNGIATALYILIFFFIVIAIILAFFNVQALSR